MSTFKKQFKERALKSLKQYAKGYVYILIFIVAILILIQFSPANLDPHGGGKGVIKERSLEAPFVCKGLLWKGMGEGPNYGSYCGLISFFDWFIHWMHVFGSIALFFYLILATPILPLLFYFNDPED